ncbi:Uncharacterized protein MSYG_0403 [Malassezia sympodialis ATCC 42132]|uniref:Metaxin glutathione S-transferase domain-containing protein n=1 Tax=Malassezia sympodialis (strain ATCC 42132) TaxID=1230383 RepID=A0A1M8A0T9_MALS4|nr:Uncharacterized protein MSYG_0403 [Malassezia sympodialis ATCC 42132]
MSVAVSAAYPELDDIQPAPPRPWSTRWTGIPMPDVIRRLFRQFPRHVWPPAQAVLSDDDAGRVPKRLVLHVTPALPRAENSWASADPVCLRWQMELLFRGASFDCEPATEMYWTPDGQLPVAELPPGERMPRQSGTSQPPLLGSAALTHYVDNYLPFSRPETDEKAVWPDKVADEVLLWQNLLEGRIMAGTLLACLRAGVYAPPPTQAPLLRRWLSGMLPGEVTAEQAALARLARLSTSGASPSSLVAVFGRDPLADTRNPLALVPGYSVDWVGFLSGNTDYSAPDAATADYVPPGLRIDQDAIVRDAVEALEAVATRLEAQSAPQGSDTWFLGASRPTHLDALLFAVLYTLAMLPADAIPALTRVVSRHAALGAYRQRLHTYLP